MNPFDFVNAINITKMIRHLTGFAYFDALNSMLVGPKSYITRGQRSTPTYGFILGGKDSYEWTFARV